MLDYKPNIVMVDTVMVEVANPNHPFGVRRVGEAPIVLPMAALSNAIYHAVGVRVDRLPMSSGAILEAMWGQEGSRGGGR